MISWHSLGKPDIFSPLLDGSYGVLPTPSPELDQASIAQDFFGNHGHPTWETLRHAQPVSAGTKRSHDYGVEEFFTDMKKRRLEPSYDPRKSFRTIATCVVAEPFWQIWLNA